MAVVSSTYWQFKPFSSSLQNPSFKFPIKQNYRNAFFPSSPPPFIAKRASFAILSGKEDDPIPSVQDEDDKSLGVKAALSMLKFYKREISPLMPNSCRYVPTCSEYSMEAYKRYGVVKGTILTGWRLCRCNPLGGSGFDPPRWFGEENPPE
ncbi:hypothetical protein AQUCO_00900953v1 [Aquilegia coerulea]|uniref:Membrane protein insertion efficiency factor n=1 Tax=Aquilegia coerulea TaxID=218851 RepID=A0A2G5EG34_AQUCA|nr:hypothetical protein AQUCO_00900953v1 [Aquilegia coerulea]